MDTRMTTMTDNVQRQMDAMNKLLVNLQQNRIYQHSNVPCLRQTKITYYLVLNLSPRGEGSIKYETPYMR